MKPTRTDYVRQAWLIILLALFYGGALAGVQLGLSGRIEENRRNEIYGVIPSLAPGADREATRQVAFTGPDGRDWTAYQAFDEDGVHRGWVVFGSGQGFVDRIDMLIGFDAERETVTGIYVLEQKETPGLGDFITHDWFRERFAGRAADTPLEVVRADPREPHQVESLTAATITTETVADIVNRAAAAIRAWEPPPEAPGTDLPAVPEPAPYQLDGRSGGDE